MQFIIPLNIDWKWYPILRLSHSIILAYMKFSIAQVVTLSFDQVKWHFLLD